MARGRRAGLPQWVPREDWERLVAAAESARDRAVIGLLLWTGLRVGELVALDVEHVDLTARTARVERGKGGAGRVAYFGRRAAELVGAYLPERLEPKAGEGNPLFVSARRRRLSKRWVEQVVAAAGERAGLGRVWPHKLRHSCLTALAKQRKPLPVIQRQAGHKRLDTTQIYLHFADEERAEAMEDL